MNFTTTKDGVSDSLVRCDKCGNERRVSFDDCTGRGWPECCGYTMTLARSPLGGDDLMVDSETEGEDEQKTKHGN